MDISGITDIQKLKALAYDQMIMLEQVQRNLALITSRIAEIENPLAEAQPIQPPASNSKRLSVDK